MKKMSYYYDIILNWNESRMYHFYEWNDTDYLELIKKIPFIKIKHKVFLDFLTHEIKVTEELLSEIKDKTIVSLRNGSDKLGYASLFTDGKNIIAIEFNKEGISTNRSELLLEDEINALESTFNMKEKEISYELMKELNLKTSLRQIEEVKRLITLEINNLYQNKELSKLKYLYYEYKQEKCEEIDKIYQTFLTDLNNNFNQNLIKLYYIIKLSYHKV